MDMRLSRLFLMVVRQGVIVTPVPAKTTPVIPLRDPCYR